MASNQVSKDVLQRRLTSKAMRFVLKTSISLLKGFCFKKAFNAFFGVCVTNFIKFSLSIIKVAKLSFKTVFQSKVAVKLSTV